MTPRSENPYVLFLSGPAGSGKSTVARAWAEQQPTVTAHIDVDHLRTFIRSGRARPDVDWNDDAAKQWNLAVSIAAQMAHIYIAEGITVVIDVYAPPCDDPEDPWVEKLDGLAVHYVYLLPSLEICLARNARRSGEALLSEEAMRRNHEGFEYCVRQTTPPNLIDNSDLTIDETVAEVGGLLSK